MDQQAVSAHPCWNLFVRELQHVLQQQGLDLQQLCDQGSISRETLRHLTQSLHTPPDLPLLSVEEMDRLIQIVQPGPQDMLRLKAALLATAAQRELLPYMWYTDTPLIAQNIFPIILQSLVVHGDRTDPGAIRGDIEGEEDSGLDYVLAPAVNVLHQGRGAFYQSRYTTDPRACIRSVWQAYRDFTEAIELLNDLPSNIRQTQPCRHWLREMQRDLAAARKRLMELGERV